MALVESILEAVASGCSVDFRSNRGVVFVEVRKPVGDEVRVCSRGVGPYELTRMAIGPDYVLADAVQSTTRAVLEPKP